jgi:hypothetical protein
MRDTLDGARIGDGVEDMGARSQKRMLSFGHRELAAAFFCGSRCFIFFVVWELILGCNGRKIMDN